MARKRGRPKKLPCLQVKDFDRQFREACIPAFLVDRELKVLYANEYACSAFPEAEQPDGLRLLLPEDSQQECVRRIAQRENFQLGVPRLGGSHAVLIVTPIADGEEDQVAGAMVLVSCPQEEQAEVVNRSTVSALSISMRQPLSNIFATLAVMGRKTAMRQDRQYEPYLSEINQAAYQLLRNITNLVSYQHGCTGGHSPIEVVDFWGRMASLMDACDIVLHGGEVPFSYQLPDDSVVMHVSCCFAEVEEALMNIIDNACRHTRPGNQVRVTGRNTPGGVVVTVTDQGMGIQPDQMEKIYSPFYSRGQYGEPHVGMGLGLSVARQNIRANGGTLAVDSTPGAGTTVAFTLPTCDQPLTPPLTVSSGTAAFLLDHFSPVYVGLCDVATLPPQ